MDKAQAIRVLHGAVQHLSKGSSAPYRPHVRTPKQQEYAELQSLEALFGGAAGGGKTDILLDLALEHFHVPGYSALLLRRSFPKLAQPGGLIARSHEWLAGTGARWSEKYSRWTHPKGGVLQFGHLLHERDKFNYQGSEYDFVGFDELTEYTETQYLYLRSRLRRLRGSTVPGRIRSTSNPGNLGHFWVKERFVDPGDPVRPFIPALLADNPHLDQEAYREALSGLDEITRQQLEEGLWVHDGGGLVYPYRSHNLVELAPSNVVDQSNKVLGIDLGASDKEETTAFVLLAYHDLLPGLWALQSEKRSGMGPSDISQRISEYEDDWGDLEAVVVDEGALGKGYAKEFRKREGRNVVAAEKSQKLAYRRFLRGDLEKARVFIVEPENQALVDEMGSLEWNESRTDNERGASNHLTDALLYGYRYCRHYQSEAPSHKPAPGTKEWAEREEKRMEKAALDSLESEEQNWWDT